MRINLGLGLELLKDTPNAIVYIHCIWSLGINDLENANNNTYRPRCHTITGILTKNSRGSTFLLHIFAHKRTIGQGF